ncbi:Holliday junction resolvase RuvX [Candidatus Berkelbacteria bacterium]|nr:Holliday junction resolvase RuvX [Candidatus Berkelbacteria bacterium]
MSILALDLGAKRIGVAVNPVGKIVLELSTLAQTELTMQLDHFIEEYHIQTLIIGRTRSGLPLAQKIIADLAKEYPGLQTVELDETLTTKEAERQLAREGGGDSDARAARLLLEQYLNRA